ncbi:plant-specific mitochondrial import receptor subunit TOM20-domain-containing protein [Baffinella frigidus]|nr:plant-specific mitochondrial import receptor subunit TOM20-domain-containing protein [Cryptophyta sp. CCMP2293]
MEMPGAQDPRQIREITNVLEEHLVQARAQVELNPNDYVALAKWGEVLLELSMMKQGDEATAIITQCIEKLEKSLAIYPDNHNALVVLASALNARAFMQHDAEVANVLFERSKKNFQRALELDPGNQRYRQLLDAMDSAPQLHSQVVSQLQTQGGMGMSGMGAAGGAGKVNHTPSYLRNGID